MEITALKVGTSRNSLVAVKTPDGFSWGKQDVSSADSGRTNDGNATMHKNRVAKKRKISLSWKCPTGAETAAILQAFDPEYFFVQYLDPLSNTIETREFYAGDMTAPVSFITVGGAVYSSVSFDIIER